jgi:hypothetical protein
LGRIQSFLVDSYVSSLVEVRKQSFSVSSAPRLLTIASRPCIWKFLFGAAFSR